MNGNEEKKITNNTRDANRMCYFLVNMLIMLPVLIKNFSWQGAGIAAIIYTATFLIYIYKWSIDIPACTFMPVLAISDLLAYFGLQYKNIIEQFRIYRPFENVTFVFVFFVSIIIYIYIFLNKTADTSKIWRFNDIFVFIAVMSLPIGGRAGASAIWDKIGDNEASLIICYCIGILFWFLIKGISNMAAPKCRSFNDWLTVFLAVMGLLINITESNYIKMMIPDLRTALLNAPTTTFVWWKILILSVVMTVLAMGMYDDKHGVLGCDSHVFVGFVCGIILIKTLMLNYFSHSWIILIFFIICCLVNLRNEIKFSGGANLYNILITAGVAEACILLIVGSMLLNFILTAAFAATFYLLAKKTGNVGNADNKIKYRDLSLYLILIAIAAESAAYILVKRFSVSGIIYIAFAAVMSIFAMKILTWKHPAKTTAPRNYKITICILLALVCIIVSCRYGADIKVKHDYGENTISVKIKAVGKNNKLKSLKYTWTDMNGKVIEESSPEEIAKDTVLKVVSERLLITAIDEKGVVSTKAVWYPIWLIKREEAS